MYFGIVAVFVFTYELCKYNNVSYEFIRNEMYDYFLIYTYTTDFAVACCAAVSCDVMSFKTRKTRLVFMNRIPLLDLVLYEHYCYL